MEQRGRLEVRLHLLVASALDGAEGSGAQSDRFILGKICPVPMENIWVVSRRCSGYVGEERDLLLCWESSQYSQSLERISSTHKLLVLQTQRGSHLQALGLVTVPWGPQRETYPRAHSVLKLKHRVIPLLLATV
jgi:hypothetical protein